MTIEGSVINNNESKVSFEGDNWILPTDIGIIEQADATFVEKLKENGWNSTEIGGLELGFHEALINAIAHGNLGIVKPDDSRETLGELVTKKQKLFATNKKVYVNIRISKDKNKVSITVRDEGKGFDFKKIPNSTLPDGLKKTKGRGLLLMETYFDSVEYIEKGNEVTLVKERKK